MNALLKELEKHIATIGEGETVSIRQNTLGLYGKDRKGMIEWLQAHGLKAKFVEETRTIEGKKESKAGSG